MVSVLYEKKRDGAHTLCFAPLLSLAVRDDIRPAEVCRLYWPYCRIFVSLSDISKERYARLPVALAKANGYLCGLTFQKNTLSLDFQYRGYGASLLLWQADGEPLAVLARL